MVCVGLLTACVTDTVTDDSDQCPKSTLTLNFTIPANTVTKATTTASAYESTIHNLKVWLFETGSNIPASFKELNPAESSQASDYSVRLQMQVPKTITTADLYIVANSDAVDGVPTLNLSTTRATLESATFGAAPTAVTTKGLPLARVVKGLTVTDFTTTDVPASISLLRSVAKVGVYFSKDVTMGSTEVRINSVKINNGFASAAGSLFPASVAYSDATVYATNANVPSATTYGTWNYFSGSTTLSKSVSGAIASIGSTETGDAYKARIASGSDFIGTETYLLESAQTSTCTVNYTVGGVTSEKTFSLWSAIPGLIRNHEVVIYGHFIGADLYIQPIVLPWTNADKIIYDTSNIVASIVSAATYKASSTRIYAAYDASATGKYYPKFTLTFSTPAVDRWLLQSTNPDFGFKINLTDDIQDYIEGVGGSGNPVTFYVVPKNNFKQSLSGTSQYNASLFLTVPSIPTLGRIKFNTSSLPGNTDATEVYIQQISLSDPVWN